MAPTRPKVRYLSSSAARTLSTCPSQDTLLQEQGYPMSGASNSSFPNHSPDIDLEAMGDIPLIGIFMHGGGYCHMSAEEKSPTSKIPRRLTKVRATLAWLFARGTDYSSFSRGIPRMAGSRRSIVRYRSHALFAATSLTRTHLLPHSCRIQVTAPRHVPVGHSRRSSRLLPHREEIRLAHVIPRSSPSNIDPLIRKMFRKR